MLVSPHLHVTKRCKNVCCRVEYFRSLYRLVTSQSSSDQNAAAPQKRGRHTRPVLSHLTVNRPVGSVWIIDLVCSEKSALQRATAYNLNSPIPQQQRFVTGTVVEHMMPRGKGLLNRIKDIDRIMGTRSGKASGHQHSPIAH